MLVIPNLVKEQYLKKKVRYLLDSARIEPSKVTRVLGALQFQSQMEATDRVQTTVE